MTAEQPDAAAVRAALAETIGSDPGELELSPVEGGASRQTFLARSASGRSFAVRRDPPGARSFAALGAGVNDLTSGGTKDLVVIDNVIYGEPNRF